MKREIKTEPTEDSGLPACMAQPVYGASMSTHNGMPPPPGIEPVTLPQSTENGDGDVKLEPGVDDRLVLDDTHRQGPVVQSIVNDVVKMSAR